MNPVVHSRAAALTQWRHALNNVPSGETKESDVSSIKKEIN